MKPSIHSLSATALACLLAIVLTSCKVQEEPILPEVNFDACGLIGTVVEHTCGLYIAVEKGPNIYPISTKNVSLSPGMKVRLGYYRSTSSYNTSHNGTCGGGEGNCGCGNSSQNTNNTNSSSMSAEATCMMEDGIHPAVITCIEVDDELD